MLNAALAFVARGWSVFPLCGKLPRFPWKETQTSRATEAVVQQWWEQHPDSWVGVALGRVSNLVRIDADGPEAVERLLSFGELPETLEFTTPSGGRGWLFSYQEGIVTELLWSGKGLHQELRVMSDGSYTVVPPSPGYVWVREAKLAAVPRWLRDRNVERVLKDLERELRPTIRQPDISEIHEALKHVPADDYDMWVQVGMALKSAGEGHLQTWEAWSKSSSKYVAGECENKWQSFRNDGRGLTVRSILYWAEQADGWKMPNRHEPLTDLGNARILARMGEGKIKHSSVRGWVYWDGTRWSLTNAEKKVVELQKQVLEYRFNRAIESLTRCLKADIDEETKNKRKKAKGATLHRIRMHESETRIRGARVLAQSEPALSVDFDTFDTRTFYLNVPNGTIDLSTMELRKHEPQDMLTQLCPVEYYPDAVAPRWLRFLAEVLPDADVRDFLQQFLGACLTSDVSMQIMPVFWGTGANGKSTLINTVLAVLGDDYSMKAKRDLLMLKRHSEHPTSVARLCGKRFVACVETAEDGRLDETLVKELTGGDKIAARFMRQDEWEFFPTHKPVLVTNHKPEIRGTDDAVWRRLPLVPFTSRFLAADADPGLPDALLVEAPGILKWMLDGCGKWLANGRRLVQPSQIRVATESYRAEQDRLGTFLTERCVTEKGLRVRTEKLLEAYTSWCVVNKHAQMNGNAFGRALTERGYPMEAKGSKYRLGLDVQQ